MAEFFAPAKINLWLRIFAPDSTGYHPLDTLFCALDLADVIEFGASKSGIGLRVNGPDVGPNDRNLAYRAAVEFYNVCGLQPRIAIHLQKNVPAGGGLGGGSSDAATVLLALNQLHDGVVPDADLMAIAARLGSDVSFFLCGSSLAHATGRGEVLRAMPPLPRAPVLVAVPPFAVATVDAYRWLDEAQAFSSPDERTVDSVNGWDEVARHAVNDFEKVLFDKHPALGDVRRAIAECGASVARLSGSGSAIFGVYESEAARDAACLELNRRFPEIRLIATSTRA